MGGGRIGRKAKISPHQLVISSVTTSEIRTFLDSLLAWTSLSAEVVGICDSSTTKSLSESICLQEDAVVKV